MVWKLDQDGWSSVDQEYSVVNVMHSNSGQEVSSFDCPKFCPPNERGIHVSASIYKKRDEIRFNLENFNIDYYTRIFRSNNRVFADLGRLFNVEQGFQIDTVNEGEYDDTFQTLSNKLEREGIPAGFLQAIAVFYLLRGNNTYLTSLSKPTLDFLEATVQKSRSSNIDKINFSKSKDWELSDGRIARKDGRFYEVILKDDRPKMREFGQGLLMNLVQKKGEEVLFFLQGKVEGGRGQITTALQASKTNRAAFYDGVSGSAFGEVTSFDQSQDDFFFDDKINTHEIVEVVGDISDAISSLNIFGEWMSFNDLATTFKTRPDLISPHLLENIGGFIIQNPDIVS